MPITTKNIIIDDAEEPNAVSAPARVDPHKPYYAAPARRATHAGNFTPLLFGVGLMLGGIAIYFLFQFVNYMSYVNSTVSDIDRVLLVILKIAVAFGLASPFIAGGVWLFGAASAKWIIRLQNGMPVSTAHILLGWRDNANKAAIFASLNQYYAERHEWARNSGYWSLNTLDASQSVSGPRNELNAPALQLTDNAIAPLHVPPKLGEELTIQMLLRHGLIDRSGNSFLIGMSNQKPHYIELDDSGFIGVAGMAGAGKSGTVRAVIAQTLLLSDSIVIVCDKHGKKLDSLLGSVRPIHNYLARAAIDIDDIVKAIDYWYEIGSNRLLEDTDRRYPEALLVIDEFTAMIANELLPASTLLKLLGGAVEFRKVQAHGIIAGHSWTGKLMGAAIGAPLRRAMTDRIVHRIDPQDAGFLLPNSHKSAVTGLRNGEVIYVGANQLTPLTVTVPEFIEADFTHLAGMLAARMGNPATASASQTAAPLGNVAAVASVAEALQSVAVLPSADSSIGVRPSGNPRVNDLTNDGRIRLASILLLKKQASGEWLYSIDQVQTLTGLRTATVVDVSRSVKRSSPK